MRKFELPAKTFLLGEYLALSGGPAILYLTPPPFTLRETEGERELPFHPESPAGKLILESTSLAEQSLEWINPYAARGGFGASSAEFAGLFLFENAAKIGEMSNTELAWLARDKYLSLHGNTKNKPSGLDVVAQTYSALTSPFSTLLLYIDANTRELTELPTPTEKKARIELLHTGRKLATHEHLNSLEKKIPESEAKEIVLEAKRALLENNVNGVLGAIDDYQALLQSAGLSAPFTIEQIKELHTSPRVLAAKGCGAMGSDVIACFQTPEAPHFRHAIFSELW